MWGSDLTTEVDPYQARLGFMVRLNKHGGFKGRDELERIQVQGPSHHLLLLDVDGGDADCLGGEPIFSNNTLVGQTTSGGYAHFSGKSLAIGWIEADAGGAGSHFEIELFGEYAPAIALAEPPFDPDNARLKG